MRLLQPLAAAYETLGIDEKAGPVEIKRAYRRAVAAHPPDRDPAGFRAIRSAYELIGDPIPYARKHWDRTVPNVDLPQLPDMPPPPPRHAVAVELFRVVVARLPAKVYLSKDPSS